MHHPLHELDAADPCARRCRVPSLQDAHLDRGHLLPWLRILWVLGSARTGLLERVFVAPRGMLQAARAKGIITVYKALRQGTHMYLKTNT